MPQKRGLASAVSCVEAGTYEMILGDETQTEWDNGARKIMATVKDGWGTGCFEQVHDSKGADGKGKANAFLFQLPDESQVIAGAD